MATGGGRGSGDSFVSGGGSFSGRSDASLSGSEAPSLVSDTEEMRRQRAAERIARMQRTQEESTAASGPGRFYRISSYPTFVPTPQEMEELARLNQSGNQLEEYRRVIMGERGIRNFGRARSGRGIPPPPPIARRTSRMTESVQTRSQREQNPQVKTREMQGQGGESEVSAAQAAPAVPATRRPARRVAFQTMETFPRAASSTPNLAAATTETFNFATPARPFRPFTEPMPNFQFASPDPPPLSPQSPLPESFNIRRRLVPSPGTPPNEQGFEMTPLEGEGEGGDSTSEWSSPDETNFGTTTTTTTRGGRRGGKRGGRGRDGPRGIRKEPPPSSGSEWSSPESAAAAGAIGRTPPRRPLPHPNMDTEEFLETSAAAAGAAQQQSSGSGIFNWIRNTVRARKRFDPTPLSPTPPVTGLGPSALNEERTPGEVMPGLDDSTHHLLDSSPDRSRPPDPMPDTPEREFYPPTPTIGTPPPRQVGIGMSPQGGEGSSGTSPLITPVRRPRPGVVTRARSLLMTATTRARRQREANLQIQGEPTATSTPIDRGDTPLDGQQIRPQMRDATISTAASTPDRDDSFAPLVPPKRRIGNLFANLRRKRAAIPSISESSADEFENVRRQKRPKPLPSQVKSSPPFTARKVPGSVELRQMATASAPERSMLTEEQSSILSSIANTTLASSPSSDNSLPIRPNTGPRSATPLRVDDVYTNSETSAHSVTPRSSASPEGGRNIGVDVIQSGREWGEEPQLTQAEWAEVPGNIRSLTPIPSSSDQSSSALDSSGPPDPMPDTPTLTATAAAVAATPPAPPPPPLPGSPIAQADQLSGTEVPDDRWVGGWRRKTRLPSGSVVFSQGSNVEIARVPDVKRLQMKIHSPIAEGEEMVSGTSGSDDSFNPYKRNPFWRNPPPRENLTQTSPSTLNLTPPSQANISTPQGTVASPLTSDMPRARPRRQLAATFPKASPSPPPPPPAAAASPSPPLGSPSSTQSTPMSRSEMFRAVQSGLDPLPWESGPDSGVDRRTEEEILTGPTPVGSPREEGPWKRVATGGWLRDRMRNRLPQGPTSMELSPVQSLPGTDNEATAGATATTSFTSPSETDQSTAAPADQPVEVRDSSSLSLGAKNKFDSPAWGSGASDRSSRTNSDLVTPRARERSVRGRAEGTLAGQVGRQQLSRSSPDLSTTLDTDEDSLMRANSTELNRGAGRMKQDFRRYGVRNVRAGQRIHQEAQLDAVRERHPAASTTGEVAMDTTAPQLDTPPRVQQFSTSEESSTTPVPMDSSSPGSSIEIGRSRPTAGRVNLTYHPLHQTAQASAALAQPSPPLEFSPNNGVNGFLRDTANVRLTPQLLPTRPQQPHELPAAGSGNFTIPSPPPMKRSRPDIGTPIPAMPSLTSSPADSTPGNLTRFAPPPASETSGIVSDFDPNVARMQTPQSLPPPSPVPTESPPPPQLTPPHTPINRDVAGTSSPVSLHGEGSRVSLKSQSETGSIVSSRSSLLSFADSEDIDFPVSPVPPSPVPPSPIPPPRPLSAPARLYGTAVAAPQAPRPAPTQTVTAQTADAAAQTETAAAAETAAAVPAAAAGGIDPMLLLAAMYMSGNSARNAPNAQPIFPPPLPSTAGYFDFVSR